MAVEVDSKELIVSDLGDIEPDDSPSEELEGDELSLLPPSELSLSRTISALFMEGVWTTELV